MYWESFGHFWLKSSKILTPRFPTPQTTPTIKKSLIHPKSQDPTQPSSTSYIAFDLLRESTMSIAYSSSCNQHHRKQSRVRSRNAMFTSTSSSWLHPYRGHVKIPPAASWIGNACLQWPEQTSASVTTKPSATVKTTA